MIEIESDDEDTNMLSHHRPAQQVKQNFELDLVGAFFVLDPSAKSKVPNSKKLICLK